MSENGIHDSLSDVIARCSCRILVLGGIGSGKTTLVNTLLGEEILPSSISSVTSAVAEVSYSQKKKVLVYPGALPDADPAEPFAIKPEISEISSFLRKGCLSVSADSKGERTVPEVEKIKIFWPIAFLKSGIAVVDTPGPYEAKHRAHILREYICKADVILYCVNGTAGFGVNDKNTLQQINAMWVRPPVIVTTFFDCVTAEMSAQEVQEYMDFCHTRYGNHTQKKFCFYVDSGRGLQGKREKNRSLLVKSGYDKLERFLTESLAEKYQERLTVELIRFSEEKDRQIRVTQTALEDAGKQGILLKGRFQSETRKLRGAIESKLVPEFCRNLYQNMDWNDYRPAVAFERFEPVQSCGEIAKDCAAELVRRVNQDILNWEKQMFQPALRKAVESLFSVMKESLETFGAAIRRICRSRNTEILAQTLQTGNVNILQTDKYYKPDPLLLSDFLDLAENAGEDVGARSGLLASTLLVQKRIKKRLLEEMHEYMRREEIIRRISDACTQPIDDLEKALNRAVWEDIEAAEKTLRFLKKQKIEEEQKIIRYREERRRVLEETKRIADMTDHTQNGQDRKDRQSQPDQTGSALAVTFDRALLKTIQLAGRDVLKDRQKLIAHLSDLAPACRKEIRIFAKCCSPALLEWFLADIPAGSRRQTVEKAKIFLQEEEGLSPEWAKCVTGSLAFALGWMTEEAGSQGVFVF